MKQRGRPKKTVRNPFVFSDKIRTKKITLTTGANKYSKDDGGAIYDVRPKDLDINLVHIAPELLEILSKKSTKAGLTQLTFYVLSLLYRGREQVQIDTEKASEATGFSPAVISRLIAELVKLKVIKRVNVNNKYWINPMMIFKGNRVNYIRKQASKEEQKTLFNFIKSKEEKQLDDLNENKECEPIKNT